MSAGRGPKSNNSASRGGARERAEGGTTDVGPASGRARRHRTTRPRLVRALAHGLLVVQGRQCALAWSHLCGFRTYPLGYGWAAISVKP